MIRTHKPKAHLKLDIALFSLMVILLVSIILQLVFAHDQPTRGHIMLGYIHGVAGVLMTTLVTLHLLWHTPWITAQLKGLLHGDKRAQFTPPRQSDESI